MKGTNWMALLLLGAAGALRAADEPIITTGPMVGHVTADTAYLWARAAAEGVHTLVLREVDALTIHSAVARASADNDLCMTFQVQRLAPDTVYRYSIASPGNVVFEDESMTFRTAPSAETKQVVKLAFGSCAAPLKYPQQPVWRRIGESGADALVLLGDTPYIDSTDLKVQWERYRGFYELADVRLLIRRLPVYATWDDHDFGKDDATGKLAGKANSRRAFVDYHAQGMYGAGQEGVYTRFRRGPVEVFLLDTRYFAQAEPSPFAADKPSLLGKAQWQWLSRELPASTATFKVLACGMVWNSAVPKGKVDHWAAYPHEREALLKLIGEKRIGGVVLVGGDIHRSRALKHDTKQTIGYDLIELIASPLANATAKAPTAGDAQVLLDAEHSHSFLLMTIDGMSDPPSLKAQVMTAEGRPLFAVELDANQLSR